MNNIADSPCGRCPCPDICLRRPGWCEWMAAEPRDPLHVRAVVNRSRIAAGLAATTVEPVYPALTTQAASLATSLWAWAVDGFRIADEAEQARRRAICAACPEWEATARRCRICGCHTDAKIALRSAHCPLPVPKW